MSPASGGAAAASPEDGLEPAVLRFPGAPLGKPRSSAKCLVLPLLTLTFVIPFLPQSHSHFSFSRYVRTSSPSPKRLDPIQALGFSRDERARFLLSRNLGAGETECGHTERVSIGNECCEECCEAGVENYRRAVGREVLPGWLTFGAETLGGNVGEPRGNKEEYSRWGNVKCKGPEAGLRGRARAVRAEGAIGRWQEERGRATGAGLTILRVFRFEEATEILSLDTVNPY